MVAAEAARLVAGELGRGHGRSLTARIPLPGGATGDFAAFRRRQAPLLADRCGLGRPQVELLLGRYGARTPRLLALLEKEPELARPVVTGSPLLAAEVVYAVDCELARTPEDVLRRRTPLALGRGRGLAELAAVIDLLGDRLGTPVARREQWRNEYRTNYSTP